MNENGLRNFYYLNRDGRWPDFHRQGVEIGPDGALQLASVPLLLGSLPPAIASLPKNEAPAGLAIGPDGSVYYSQPDEHRVMWIDGCDGGQRPLPCVDGEGKRPTQLKNPRGLLLHPLRPALLVADSNNHRIQLFDPRTFQLLDIWGSLGEEPGQFDQPWDLAADEAGNIYVVDAGENKRVQKFDLRGNVLPGFARQVAESQALMRPVAVAVAEYAQVTWVLVLDAEPPGLCIFDTRGTLIDRHELDMIQEPLALEVAGSTVYVGDNERRCVHVLRWAENKTSLRYVGQAQGYNGRVAALAAAGNKLWLLPGGASDPLQLAIDQGHIKRGLFWVGPFSHQERPVQWHRLQALIDKHTDSATVQFFVCSSDEFAPSQPDLANELPFVTPDWKPLPIGAAEGLVPGTRLEPNEPKKDPFNFLPARYLWLGALFNADGRDSVTMRQLRLEFDHTTYRQFLPPIFSKGKEQRELWDRLLSLFESFFGEVEVKIEDLSRYFDPQAVPAGWLPWLATWVALELDDNWSEEQKRRAIAGEMARAAHRGTAYGLQELLYQHGVIARIEEPHVHANWWMLVGSDTEAEADASALLGVGTMLVAAEADGAVVGRTATLDRSHLITDEERGAPLFTNTAHQFSVQLFRGQAEQPGLLNRVRAIVDEEMPAHTSYHLCVIEPRMRVGFQARLGIDTVVAGPLPPARMNGTVVAGVNLMLGGDPPGRMGTRSQVGQTTRLTEGSTK